MEFAGVKSECLQCFISSHPCLIFPPLVRLTTNDLSSLAADYSARYHRHSVLFPFPFRLLSRRDKDARLVKLVVAVYEFFGEDIAQIEFTRADGRYPVAFALCPVAGENNWKKRERERERTDRIKEKQIDVLRAFAKCDYFEKIAKTSF